MDYRFSDRIASMKPSLVREILKATSNPEVIPFAAGNPAPDAFPVEEVARITAELFSENPIAALQYSVSEGYPALRDACKNLMETRYHTPMRDDELIVVSGGQQGTDLAAKVLVNEGDTVLCEEPSFIGCLNCWRSYNANLVGIEMEDDGLNLEKLERAMQEEKNVKVLYVIPNFQNPSGITTSEYKRREILRLAKKYGVIILEDNPYGDLRFEGEHVPSIKSMDEDGIVIYVGSFSKIIAPALRVGYVVAAKPLIAKMVVGKQCADVHTNMIAQLICERFVSTCDLDVHIARVAEIYRRKCNLMIRCMDEQAPEIRHTHPQGGLFLWCTLPDGVDMMEFCSRAVQRNVAVVPGIAFLAKEGDMCNSFRMNFSTPTDDMIVRGCGILGEVMKEMA